MTDVTISAGDARTVLTLLDDNLHFCCTGGCGTGCGAVARLRNAVRAASSATETPVQPVTGSRDDRTSETASGVSTRPHAYLSTACHHERIDGLPELHASCRRTCKFCGAGCWCGGHAREDTDAPRDWVHQARSVAVELREALDRLPYDAAPELSERVRSDPALFWLRRGSSNA